HADETGGLSGPPVHELSLAVIRRLRERLGGETAIIGEGGISSGTQAREKIEAGADAVQLYTGLIYRRHALIEECVRAVCQRATARHGPAFPDASMDSVTRRKLHE